MLSEIKNRLEINPNDAQAHWQYGCFLGFTNKWEEAWKELEWRFKGNREAMFHRGRFIKPDYNGGKLLAFQDQGFGDLFQYARFLKGLDCIVEVYPSAYSLLKFQGFNVIGRGHNLPEHDCVSAICSLAYHLKVKEPTGEPYFIAPMPDRLKHNGKIGIAWAGAMGHFTERFCAPENFLKLEKYGEIVSLMMHKSGLPFLDFSSKIRDFLDTAEIISQLDCVVSVDTAVAHLAGALGKKVYLILSYEHDFKWGNENTTPWYSSMTIIRQKERGNWNSVFTELIDMLK